MAVFAGFGPLEPFIGAEEGVSLIGFNGKYWSSNKPDESCFIKCCKNTKDLWCKFLVEKIGNSKIRMKDRTGMYLHRNQRGNAKVVEVTKNQPDRACDFEVFTKGEKLVFKADNGNFLSFSDGHNNIDATKEGVDRYCEFTPTIGDVISPKFEIISVDLEKIHDVTYEPSAVKEETYINKSSVDQKHKFNMSWTKTESETTAWKHNWGLDNKLTFDIKLVTVSVTLSYSGSYGKTSTKEKSITMGEQTEVTIPSKSKITVKLIASKDENVTLPFVAKIKKTKSNGEELTFTECGTWKGVLYERVQLIIEEETL